LLQGVSGILKILAQVGDLGSELVVGGNVLLDRGIGSRLGFGVGESSSSSRELVVDGCNR